VAPGYREFRKIFDEDAKRRGIGGQREREKERKIEING
jgi:hypothetical protein